MSELRDELEPLGSEETDLEVEETEDASEAADGLEDLGEPGEEQDLGQPDQEQTRQKQNANDVRPSRSRQRFERAEARHAEERRRWEADRADFQRQLAEVSQRLAQPSPAELIRQETEERERLALMAPHELVAYTQRKIGDQVSAQLRQMQFTGQISSDQMTFRTLEVTDPLAKRYASKVEAQAMELEKRGQFVPREMILSKIVGDEVRAKAARERAKQQRSGRQRVAAQVTRPANGRADTGTPARAARGDYAAVLDRLKSATF